MDDIDKLIPLNKTFVQNNNLYYKHSRETQLLVYG